MYSRARAVCSVDATREDPALGFGRLLNHSRTRPNLVPHKVVVDGVPHIVMVTSRDIAAGEELLYDYGERDERTLQAYPWLAGDTAPLTPVPAAPAARPRRPNSKAVR